LTYKVVQGGTGNLGTLAVQSILKHPDLELIGTWVSSSQKAGRDVGELCGVAPVGLLATQDAEALITGDADCSCYAANSMGREDQVVDDCVRMLAAGKNVVNVSDPALVYPKAKGGTVYDRLQQACLAGSIPAVVIPAGPGSGSRWRRSRWCSKSARSGCSRSTTTARGTTRSWACTASASPTPPRR
jgi:hypothetical protein